MKQLAQLTLAIGLSLTGVVATVAHAAVNVAADSSQAAATEQAMSQGEIKKVDTEAGKITIKHGPLKNLGMPGMTMVFHVKDKAMLDQVKAGDNIHFVAEKMDGKLMVTRLEKMQ